MNNCKLDNKSPSIPIGKNDKNSNETIQEIEDAIDLIINRLEVLESKVDKIQSFQPISSGKYKASDKKLAHKAKRKFAFESKFQSNFHLSNGQLRIILKLKPHEVAIMG